jgi:integrase
VAYYGGLRRGELIALELADIDLARQVIELRETKNGEARIVPILDGPMLQWLQWSDQHKHHGQVKAFCWDDGRPFTVRNFYDQWHAAAARAGIPDYIPHDSRRSANRNLRDTGVPKELRKSMLGWKTDSMEERYGIADNLRHAEEIRAILAAKTTAETTAAQKRGRSAKSTK